MLTPSPSRPRSRAGCCRCSRLLVLDAALDRDPLRLILLLHERDLDPQDAVLVCRARGLGLDVRPELHDAPEGPGGDLDLRVEAPASLLGAPLAGDDQLPPPDLERDLVDL